MAPAARLVGREAELRALSDALQAVRRAEPRVVLIAGDAGIGKSRLITEFLQTAAAATALRGYCPFQLSTGLSYAPIVQALRPLAGSNELAALPRHHVEALRPVLPLVDCASPGQPRWVQSRLFEVLFSFLGGLGRTAPVILAIEDLHWADPGTLDLIQFLARNVTVERLLLIGSYRIGEPEIPDWLSRALAAIPASTTLELAPLPADAAQELVSSILGAESDMPSPEAILRRAAGNPLYLEQLALASQSQQARTVPPRLRDLLAWRLERLSPAARRVLDLVSVAGPATPYELLEEALGTDYEAVEIASREALASHLLVQDEAGQLSLKHALLAELVYQELTPGRRSRLHGRVAEYLSRQPTAMQDLTASAVLARHWTLAGHPAEAFSPLLAAATTARQRGLQRDAARLFGELLQLWPEVSDTAAAAGVTRVDLLTWYADSLRWNAETEAVLAAYSDASAAADKTGDPQCRAAVRQRWARALFDAGLSDEALSMAAEACALLGDVSNVTTARAHATLGAVLMIRGDFEASVGHCEQAQQIAVACGARRESAHALRLLGVDLANLGQLNRAVELLESALEICTHDNLVEDEIHTHVNLSYVLERAGRWDAALASARAGRRLAELSGLGSTLGVLLAANEASALAASGRWSEATSVLALPIAPGASREACRYLELIAAEIAVARGEIGAARHLVPAGQAESGSANEGQRRIVELELALVRNDNVAAYAGALSALAELDQALEPYLSLRLCAAGLRALAELASPSGRTLVQALGLPWDPDVLLQRASGYASTVADLKPCQLLLTLCRNEAGRFAQRTPASDWLLLAKEFDELGQPQLKAYCDYRAAECGVLAGNLVGVAELLHSTQKNAVALGAAPLLGLVTTLAARAGISLDPGTPRPAESGATRRARLLGLTAREREVLSCLAAGASNRQIARALTISEKTASVHVSNILAKLQVRTRGEAVAAIHRLALVDKEEP